MASTTAPGFVNRNDQIVIRDTGQAGTDHLQRVYVLHCAKCDHVYGANGSDIHERKCPSCQGGAPGFPCRPPLEAAVACPRCGLRDESRSRFCSRCGLERRGPS